MKYLETMEGNRVVRQSHVDFLAAQMKRGKWRKTHQGIAFDKEGRLCDGQHRLWAIIESGEAQDIMVTRGIDPEDVAVLDGGLVRNYDDNAHYAGWDDDPTGAGIAKYLALGPGLRAQRIPADVVHGWYLFYREQADFGAAIRLGCRPTTGKSITLAMAAAFARALPTVGAMTLTRMGEIMKTGQISVEADRAAFVLRDVWLSGNLGKNATEQYAKTEGAIRAFHERRPIKKLQKPESELFEIKKLPFDKRYSNINTRDSPRAGTKARAKLSKAAEKREAA
jgi:hypothetical protein